MANLKIINKNNLEQNLSYINSFNFPIIAMVKANAYGHDMKVIAKLLKDKVNFFGVANKDEAINLRKILKNKNILVVGKSKSFLPLIKNNIDITIDELLELKQINKLCKKHNLKANVHIAINTGMNRIGVKTINDFKQILSFINNSHHIKLKGIFTHLFDADERYTNFYKQMEIFKRYAKLVINKKTLIHIGGSFVLTKKIPKFINMVRVGFFMYGYGNKNLKPIMKITSKVIKITNCKKGEYVGYGKTRLSKNTKIALIPMGYADGIFRNLSNKANVIVNGIECKIVGKICMDMFMVDITNKKVRIGDIVEVFTNAEQDAKLLKTSPYEILTNYSKSRTKTVIQNE